MQNPVNEPRRGIELGRVIELARADLTRHHMSLEIGLFDLRSRRWLTGGGADPEGFPTDGYVLALGANETLLLASTPADVLTEEIVSLIQDRVIDETGRPWPTVQVDGETPAVLEPRLVDGTLVWMSHGTPVARLGQLAPEA